jgi:ribosomal protein S18 acetylase RimI-like enzyme
MNYLLRYATDRDAALVADISRKTFMETFAPYNSKEDMDIFMNQQFTRGKLMLEVKAPENTFLLAFQDQQIAGYVKLREAVVPLLSPVRPSLEIARLYCVASHIGTGLGNLLMEKSIDLAKTKGKELVWLGVWEKNSRAIRFYEKWGFRKVSEHDFVLGKDIQRDWLMIKTF